ncbi:phage major tail tube protein [Halocynthiibacter styelae]|uniref:Phage major tail tube protein n=1 Tax=Halocynthiibacter styelae TaxID=2761955 RepID=A0A8J7ITK4_9RHOB|nr:phage major tail tube protein [Paenihalocynthiibacter styelae]MBI1495411.1 phage major tail tube protein [Paenihalocynthiibacter styelae]
MTHILRKFNAHVDGYSTHLEIEKITPPLVRDQVEAIKAGGLLGELDVPLGVQKLEAGLMVNSRNKLLMGKAGLTPGKSTRVTFRGVSVSEIDGSQQDEVLIIQGRLNVDSNDWQAQSKTDTDYKIGSITYYKHLIDGQLVYEIDLLNMIGVVDGVDQWADIRGGLGL